MKKNLQLLFIIPSRKNKESEVIDIEAQEKNKESVIVGDEIESILLTDYKIPEEDINLLQQLGFAGNDIQVYKDSNLSKKENSINYILKGDIGIKASNLVNMTSL